MSSTQKPEKQKTPKRKQKPRRSKKLRIVICLLVVAALAAGGIFVVQKKQSGTEAERVMKRMEVIIPGLGQDGSYSSGAGRDPLAALSIQGTDVVGCLEIPALDLRVPVTDKGDRKEFFATWVSGSPVKGRFRIIGSKADAFLKLPKAAPGDTVKFTDIDGVRYEYTVTTQLHLKNWDKADYDLMVCYDVDGDTQFVLGCTSVL